MGSRLRLQTCVLRSAERETITGSVLTSVATTVDQEFLTTKSGTRRSKMLMSHPNRVHRSGIGWEPRRSQTIGIGRPVLKSEPRIVSCGLARDSERLNGSTPPGYEFIPVELNPRTNFLRERAGSALPVEADDFRSTAVTPRTLLRIQWGKPRPR